MPRVKKKNSPLGLSALSVLQNVEKWYFGITELPNTLTAGKNFFKIGGNSAYLSPGTNLQIEILDAAGELVYHEVLPYIEPGTNNRYVTIWLYGDETPGTGNIIISGVGYRRATETTSLANRLITGYWAGKQNSKFTQTVELLPNSPNRSTALFLKAPRMVIKERVRQFMIPAGTPGEGFLTASGHVSYEVYPTTNPNVTYLFSSKARLRTPTSPFNSGDMDQNFKETGTSEFTSELEGGSITIKLDTTWPFLSTGVNTGDYIVNDSAGSGTPSEFTTEITKVINSTTLGLKDKFIMNIDRNKEYTGNNQSQGNIFQVLENVAPELLTAGTSLTLEATASYWGDTVFQQDTENYQSFAKVSLANIEPVIGDIRAIKVYMRSTGFQDWEFVTERNLEGNQLLSSDDEYTLDKKWGIIRNETELNTYWESASLAVVPGLLSGQNSFPRNDNFSGSATTTHFSAISKQTELMGGVAILGNDPMTVNEFTVNSSGVQTGVVTQLKSLSELNSHTDNFGEDASYMLLRAKTDIDIFEGCEYTLSFRATSKPTEHFSGSNLQYSAKMGVYLSGSGVTTNEYRGWYSHEDESWQNEFQKIDVLETLRNETTSGSSRIHDASSPTNESYPTPYYTHGDRSVNPVIPQDFSAQTIGQPNSNFVATTSEIAMDTEYLSYNFTANKDGKCNVVFKVLKGEWHISDMSIKASQQTGFCPNHTYIEFRVPTDETNNIFDFKFDFIDNNNDVVMALFTASQVFNGSNTFMSGLQNALSGSLMIGEGIVIDGFGAA